MKFVPIIIGIDKSVYTFCITMQSFSLNHSFRSHKKMLRRITIMLDDDLLKKLRNKQAKLIKKNQGSVSLSRVINDSLSDSLKK